MMKKFIIPALMICTLLMSSVTAFGVDRRITASNHYMVKTSYGGIWAHGYTTSKYKHYTSCQIWCNETGQVRTSDRNWGTGEVWAETNSLEYDSGNHYNSAVYYGF